MDFTDFPPCKHRFGCVQCRNDSKFVEHMKGRFGEWECPEKIPFGTPVEQMPEHIRTKIATYHNRLQEQGKGIPMPSPKNQIGVPTTPSIPPSGRPTDFTQTPGCIHRMMCVECRNNEKFRENIEKQMGKWECPENIPIGTSITEMPQKIQDIHTKREEQQKMQKEKMEKVRIALDGIEEAIPEQALGLIDMVRAHIFPNTKKATLCKFNTGEIKQIEQKCCGGKVKMVSGFVCEEKGDASERVCRSCQDFISKR